MAIATQITRMQTGQITASGRVLARAFDDDPLMLYILPDAKKRATGLPWFMTTAARYANRYGEVYTTGEKVAGNACWLPPGDVKVPMGRMIKSGMLVAPFKFGVGPFMRFLKVMDFFEKLHERDMHDRHWYLMLLGVEPARQGQGVGGALIQPILQRADADGLPCYLETQKERNVPFYQKHGFEVIVDQYLPDGPRFWTMKRMPRS